jgi:hypothetical protein
MSWKLRIIACAGSALGVFFIGPMSLVRFLGAFVLILSGCLFYSSLDSPD